MNRGQIIPESVYDVLLKVTSLNWWLTQEQQEWFPPLLWKGIKWSYLIVGLYIFRPDLLEILAWPIAIGR
jgi:hypothetical protein